MFIIKIAELNIRIDNRFDFVEKHCVDYTVQSSEYDFTVSADDNDIAAERNQSDYVFSDGYLESICLYRAIAYKLPEYDAFLMHCSAVEYGGNAYLFAAKSGTGKTTHTKLWRRMLGEDMHVINGDKPIMRFFDGALYACGTPWAGKEMLNTNSKARLKGICFLKQAPHNSIRQLGNAEALDKIVHQIIIPKDRFSAEKTLDMVGQMLTETNVYLLECNISEDAARLSYSTMS